MAKILCLAGDGVGPELMDSLMIVIDRLREQGRFAAELEFGLLGGASIDAHGVPLTPETLERAKTADAVMMGSVGGPKWDSVARPLRPEKGLLDLRKGMDVYANLRPIKVRDYLSHLSPLRDEVVAGADFVIVRELLGGIYFGEPRGRDGVGNDERAYDTMVYTVSEIDRIGRIAFDLARSRSKRVHSVDKANVLETSALWRQTVARLGREEYPDVELHHMYVDNAAIQLIRDPLQFDVLLTENMFGDILSDAAAAVAGSLGMLPSASLAGRSGGITRGLYEPSHGSAPDIAGKDICNPVAMLQSFAMLVRHSLDDPATADDIEAAIEATLGQGMLTVDVVRKGQTPVGTRTFCEAVASALGTSPAA